MKKLLLAVLTFGLFWACQKNENFTSVDEMVEQAGRKLKTINVEELKSRMDTFAVFNIIDVREASEYNHGYIPGAVNIPRGLLEFNIGNEEFWAGTGFYYPTLNEEFILYCKKGSRSILAAESLQKLGYKNVKIIEGGWKNWELSYPTIQEKNLDLETHAEKKEVGGC